MDMPSIDHMSVSRSLKNSPMVGCRVVSDTDLSERSMDPAMATLLKRNQDVFVMMFKQQNMVMKTREMSRTSASEMCNEEDFQRPCSVKRKRERKRSPSMAVKKSKRKNKFALAAELGLKL